MESDFTYHCRYTKYHYQKSINIVRVECRCCHSTHALIPEFSLPGTSIGTAEANNYLSLRESGVSQVSAAKIFESCGMSENYGRRFEQMVRTAEQRAKALFPEEVNPLHDPLLHFHSTDKPSSNVIQSINHAFSLKGYNPLFFSRRNILRVRENKSRKHFPLNKGATWRGAGNIDSS